MTAPRWHNKRKLEERPRINVTPVVRELWELAAMRILERRSILASRKEIARRKALGLP